MQWEQHTYSACRLPWLQSIGFQFGVSGILMVCCASEKRARERHARYLHEMMEMGQSVEFNKNVIQLCVSVSVCIGLL